MFIYLAYDAFIGECFVPNNKILGINLKDRFRGFLPIVVDIETAGVETAKKCAIRNLFGVS